MTAKVVKLADNTRVNTNYDPVFFPKDAVRVGTKFMCYGRRDPGSVWRVTDIHTYTRLTTGKYRLEPSDHVVHLDDIIKLRRIGEGKKERASTFSYMSYSAIWRLA